MERCLNIARTKTNKDKRDARDKTRDDSDWSIAADALTKVEASKFDLKVLNKPQLQSLVRVQRISATLVTRREMIRIGLLQRMR